MQGSQKNIVVLLDRLEAFCSKLFWWNTKVVEKDLKAFQTLYGFLHVYDDPFGSRQNTIVDRLNSLAKGFASYFSDKSVDRFKCVRNPYLIDQPELDEPFTEELIELKSNRDMRVLFGTTTLTRF